MLRKTLLGATATGVAVLASLALAGPAAAGQNAAVYTTDEHGYAAWTADGDRLHVCDLSADGWGVRGVVHSYNAAGGFWEYEMGVSDGVEDGVCQSVTKNVTDGRRVEITVWLYKSGHADKNHASDDGVA